VGRRHAKGLWKDNPPNGLSWCQANTQARFHLTLWNGQIGCLEDLRDHCRKEKKHGNQDKDKLGPVVNVDAQPPVQKLGQSIKDQKEQDNWRGTTQGKDIAFCQTCSYLIF